jgi:transcription elongation factor
VLRPEIIIPHAATGAKVPSRAPEAQGLTIGAAVRIIREPGFGRLGVVKSLPPEAQRVESEAKVRVVELELPDGGTMIVPRTNVEVIGS